MTKRELNVEYKVLKDRLDVLIFGDEKNDGLYYDDTRKEEVNKVCNYTDDLPFRYDDNNQCVMLSPMKIQKDELIKYNEVLKGFVAMLEVKKDNGMKGLAEKLEDEMTNNGVMFDRMNVLNIIENSGLNVVKRFSKDECTITHIGTGEKIIIKFYDETSEYNGEVSSMSNTVKPVKTVKDSKIKVVKDILAKSNNQVVYNMANNYDVLNMDDKELKSFLMESIYNLNGSKVDSLGYHASVIFNQAVDLIGWVVEYRELVLQDLKEYEEVAFNLALNGGISSYNYIRISKVLSDVRLAIFKANYEVMCEGYRVDFEQFKGGGDLV